jgi:hypothetical protein
LDERKFNPGYKVDETIIKAIDKATAFIPLISENSKQIQTGEGKLKYHIREWERAFTNKKSGAKEVRIVPVKIDNTGWLYDKFKSLFYLNVPGGQRTGDYEKLKVALLNIQQPIR